VRYTIDADSFFSKFDSGTAGEMNNGGLGDAIVDGIREKFTRERTAAKKLAAEYFERFPKDRYQTEVESWRHSAIAKYRVVREECF